MINTGRVVVAGLAAGVILNIGDALSGALLMHDEMQSMVTRLNLDPAVLTPAGAAPWIIVDFLYGILIVFAYAAIRARFGPGPKTAVVAGWMLFAAITVVLYGFYTMGIFDTGGFVKGTILSLINTTLASLVGGALYKEA
jgi:hypothetical protein